MVKCIAFSYGQKRLWKLSTNAFPTQWCRANRITGQRCSVTHEILWREVAQYVCSSQLIWAWLHWAISKKLDCTGLKKKTLNILKGRCILNLIKTILFNFFSSNNFTNTKKDFYLLSNYSRYPIANYSYYEYNRIFLMNVP